MISQRKLELCGLKYDNESKCCYKYNGNELRIDFEYHDDVIYIDMTTMKRPEKMRYLIEQLLGRFKRRKYIKIECRDTQNKLDVLLEHIKRLRNITLNVENTDIVIGRYDYPNIYDGVLRDCTITLAEQYTIKHKQIIQVRNDDVFIYFDPPLMYDRCKLIGNLSTYIETPVAICGDATNRWCPRWNKMRSYVDYKERRTYVYGSTQYIMRQKMKLSLGPAKGDYDNDYKEYQRYGRQVLHYLNNCAKRIQRSWRRSISDPNYRICRERLQNEYNYLMDQ